MKKEYGIKMVPADKLRPHPKNPRKDLGDLSELTESILISASPTILAISCNNCFTVLKELAHVSCVFWKSPIAPPALDITY